MANKTNSLSHTKWMCKYHIVFSPKYRRKIIYNQYRKSLQDIIRTLCRYKGVKIIEGHMMPDHVHLVLSIWVVCSLEKPYYLNKQFKKISSNPCVLYSSSSYDGMEEALSKGELLYNFPSDYQRERVCIFDCQKNQFLSVFYHLRNAIAHGRIDIVNTNDECVYIFEDTAPKGTERKVSARMILRKSTLIKWIDIIEHGEKKYVE